MVGRDLAVGSSDARLSLGIIQPPQGKEGAWLEARHAATRNGWGSWTTHAKVFLCGIQVLGPLHLKTFRRASQ